MKITENTTINLTVMCALIGGVLWLTSIYSVASKAAEDIVELKLDRDNLRNDIAEIKQALARIEGKLEK